MLPFGTLQSRLKDSIPPEHHSEIEREIAQFETQVAQAEPQEYKIVPAKLTSAEKSQLPIGNQHTQSPTPFQWRKVKGYAIFYNISNWTDKVDASCTIPENIEILESTRNR